MADKEQLQQKLDELQDKYRGTKYNKHTNLYLGELRAKMAKVRKAISEIRRKKGIGFGVKKTGDATVVLVGFPNAGKSSLLKRLTKAESKIADYAFTTLEVIPGTLEYNGAKIQVLDIPGLIEGAHIGKGAGTQVASVIRIADLVLFVVDATVPEQINMLIEELSLLGIKVNKAKPRIMIEEKKSGGIIVESNRQKIPVKDEVASVLHEIGIHNCKIIFYSSMDLDELIGLLIDNAVYAKGIVALNKIDLLSGARAEQLRRDLQSKLGTGVVAISASKGTNIEELKTRIFSNLHLMRIYLKPKDGEADYSKPFPLREGNTVLDLAKGLHTKAAKNLKCAYVSGKSARFGNQRVGEEHVLQDEDVVTLVYEKF